MYHGTADEIRIEAEENGWHLVVSVEGERYSFLVGVPTQLVTEVSKVKAWLLEGEAARSLPPIPEEDLALDGPYAHDWAKREGLRWMKEAGY